MKAKKIIGLLIFLFAGFSSIFAQGFQPPSKGKAVVYFTRVSIYSGASSFEFFHNDKFIGEFKGKNYMRYECDPGEQLFWASSENKEFITSNLEEGKTYIVIVDIIMGTWKAHVGLSPISIEDSEKFDRAKELINKKRAIVTKPSKVESKNSKLKNFISEKLALYNEKWKEEKNFRHISEDMAIPINAMN